MEQQGLQTVAVEISEGNNACNVVFHRSKRLGIRLPPATNTEVGDAVNQAYLKILPFEDEIMRWLAASDNNARLFYTDPFKALEASQIAIPEDVLKNMKNAAQLLSTFFKKTK